MLAGKWSQCLDTLLVALQQHDKSDESPSKQALVCVIILMYILSVDYPTMLPDYIIPEPNGGVIVEWSVTQSGVQHIVELSICNVGLIEIVYYVDGKIV
jgi:hypothetical protein